MPLMNCPECKKKVSSAADTCPHCGFPVASYLLDKKRQEHLKKDPKDCRECKYCRKDHKTWEYLMGGKIKGEGYASGEYVCTCEYLHKVVYNSLHVPLNKGEEVLNDNQAKTCPYYYWKWKDSLL